MGLLSSEQFDRRAVNGEKPAHPWEVSQGDRHVLGVTEASLLGITVRKSGDGWAILGDPVASTFASMAAAQLYVEQLLSDAFGAGFDLTAHIRRQMAFSSATFGPGTRTNGIIAHIRKELAEVEQNPTDLEEWADIILLALDGAWRNGGTPESIAEAIKAKQAKNEGRVWPDWRTLTEDDAVEHVREAATNG